MPMKRAEGREECGPKRCPRGHGTAAVSWRPPVASSRFLTDSWRTPKKQRSPPRSGGTRPARRVRSRVPPSWRACSCWAPRSRSSRRWAPRCSGTSSRRCATRSGRPPRPISRTAASAGSSRRSAQTMLVVSLPFVIAVSGAGLLASVAQVRPRLVLSGLKPDFKRVSPKGAKRIVSPHSIVELVKSVAKLSVVSGVVFATLWPPRGRSRIARRAAAGRGDDRSSRTSCSTSPGGCSARSPRWRSPTSAGRGTATRSR